MNSTRSESDKNLTVILTLKDRVSFTYRWMNYANRSGFPFRIIIADGGMDKEVTEVLSDHENYPRLNYEYIRYPYDATYPIFHAKKADALSKVDTPFVIFADNDDFLIYDGLRQAVNFLMKNKDYKTCKGLTCAFSIEPDMNATYGSIHYYIEQSAISLEQETSSERVMAHFAEYSTTYYDVHRIDDMRRYFNTLRDFDPKDVTLSELLTSFMSVASGKTKKLPHVQLLRQHHLNTNCTKEDLLMDRFDRLLLGSWSDDFSKFICAIASIIADRDGVNLEDATDRVKNGYRRYITPIILNDLRKAVENGNEPSLRKEFGTTSPYCLLVALRRVKLYLERRLKQKMLYSELLKNKEVSGVHDFLRNGMRR